MINWFPCKDNTEQSEITVSLSQVYGMFTISSITHVSHVHSIHVCE